ncbi:Dual specificity protein phosphatase 23, variant 2 [Balamuthia mandrillaris]
MEARGMVTSMEQTNQSSSPKTEEEHLTHSSRSSSCAGEQAATKTEEARKKKADRHPPSCCQKVPRATLLGKRIRVPLLFATTTTTAREEGGSVPCGGQAAEESESEEEEVDYNSPKAANTFLSILKRTKERVIGESPPSSSPGGVGTAATLLSPPSHNKPPPQPQRGEAELRERIRARRQRTDSLESSLFVPKWDSLLSHFATNSSLHQREAMQRREGEAAANDNHKNRCGEQRAQPQQPHDEEEEDTTSLRRQRLLSKWWQVERGTAHKPTPQGQRSSIVAACLPTSSILAGTVNSVGNKVNTDAEAQQQRLLDLKEEDVFVMSEEEEATNNNVPESSITASKETEEEEDNDDDDDGKEEDEEAAGTERMMLAPSEFYAARPYLFGMAVPVCNEHIRTLKALGVGLLVSATADPLKGICLLCYLYNAYSFSLLNLQSFFLKGGLMVNRQPRLSVRDVVEYTEIDQDIFKRGCGPRKIRRIHIPIVDGSPPSTQNMLNFLAEAKATIDAGKAVAVHCWQGKGRTGTLIAGMILPCGFFCTFVLVSFFLHK